jgi:intein/homing endonuclease
MHKTNQERCCSGNTLINTETGVMSIKDICDNKFSGNVWSVNHETNISELKPVTGWSVMPRKKKHWVKLTTKSGKVLIVTRNHRVFLPEIAAYREAENIIVGDRVIIR